MDEEEYQRLVSGTVGGIGAAGAIGVPIHKKYWNNPYLPEPGNLIEGMPPASNLITNLYYRADEQGNEVEGLLGAYMHGMTGGDWRLREYEDMTPFQRWAYNQTYRQAQDPTGELIDWSIPFLTLLQDKIPGLSTLIPDLSTAEDYKYDFPVETEEVYGEEIPEYTPLEFGEFKPATVDWPTRDDYVRDYESHYETKPVFDYPENLIPPWFPYGSKSDDPRVIKYNELMPAYRDAQEAFAKEEQDWFESAPDSSLYDMTTYFGEDFFEKQSADNLQKSQERDYLEKGIIDPWLTKEIELEEKNQREREAFDRRNEEEERRHREEYDKMVADMLAEETSRHTDFGMGDISDKTLEPEDFWTQFEKFLDKTIYNPIFGTPPDNTGTDGWNEPVESTPPSWLNIPSASIMPDPLNLDNALSWNNRVSPKVLNVEPSAQDIMDWNPNLFTPHTEFDTTIQDPRLTPEAIRTNPDAANRALDVLIPPLS